MISKLFLPLWAQYCFRNGRLEYVEKDDGSILVTGCRSKHECYGCDPMGTTLTIHPNKLEVVEEFCSMSFTREECPHIFMPDELITQRIKKYTDSTKQYYVWRGISSDLDTVKIFKVKGNDQTKKMC